MTTYTMKAQSRDIEAHVSHYPVDGFQLWITMQHKTMFDKRMVCYTLYEAVTGALGEIGLAWDEAENIADEMGLEPHFDDDEEDEGEA